MSVQEQKVRFTSDATKLIRDLAKVQSETRQLIKEFEKLNKVSAGILENHLNSCVTTAIRGEDPAERERVLKEIADVFETATKV